MVAVVRGYSTWCERCGWNLTPRERPASQHPLDADDRELETQFARSAFEIASAGGPAPYVPASAVILAGLVHLSTAALLLAGALGVARVFFTPGINGFGILVSLLFGIGMLLIGLAVLPQLRRCERSLSGTEVRSLLNRVAQAMGAGAPRALVADASFGIGANRIGLPLLAAVDPQEAVAAAALAVARGATSSGILGWISTAVETARRWESILVERGASDQRVTMRVGITTAKEVSRGDLDPLSAMLDAALQRLAAVPRAIGAALIRRTWLPNQVALYRADRLATCAAGNEAMISTLQKLRWDYTAANAVHRAIQSHVAPERVFDEMRAALAALPERECERLWRSADREEHIVARGEPPLAWRIELLRRQSMPARVTCDVGSAARLREELAVAEAALAQRMIDDAG